MAFQNQLQFNTSVPTYTENLAFRHHHPRALIIEKPHVQQAASAFVTRQNVSHVTRGRYLSALDILTDLQNIFAKKFIYVQDQTWFRYQQYQIDIESMSSLILTFTQQYRINTDNFYSKRVWKLIVLVYAAQCRYHWFQHFPKDIVSILTFSFLNVFELILINSLSLHSIM